MELKYRPEIDGVRAIAVLSVIIYHAEFTLGSNHLLKGGFLGVDVFFVISGFLITSLIIGEHQRIERFSFLNFYERRARRLLPALLATMLISLPFAWKYLLPTQLIDFSKSLIASLLFGSNFYWHDTLREYGTESALLKPFLHTWSLAVEEQYYIIFPLILVAIYRWYKRHTIVVLTAGFLLSLQFAEWATVGNASFSFYMLPSRLWEMIAGALLANIQYFYPQKDNDSLLNRIMPLVGLFLIFHSIIFTGFDSTHPGFITLIPVFGTVLIIWFANKKDLVTKVLSSKLFVGIGLISYSLYLWHYPIFAIGRIKDINSSVFDKFVWIILTFVLSIATFFLVERPFRNREAISRKTLAVSLLAAIAIVGTYSFYSIQNSGVRERFPKLMEIYGKNEFDNQILSRASWNILEELAKSRGMGPSEAHEPSPFEAEHLWFSNSSTTRKVLIIGNSHSKDLFNALYQNKELFPDLEFARFGMHNALLPEQINVLFESPNFKMADIVIITFRYDDTKGIPNLIEVIKNTSKKVVLVLNTVEFNDIDGRPVFDWYAETHNQNFSANGLNELFFDSQSHEKDEINESLRIIARNKDIVLLDKTDFICDMESKTCDGITDEGYKSFFDYGHFTLEGAKYFGRRIHEINWLEID
jgi:peptidoglycan/LPS O-acetylase OafA/YrhL